MSSTPIPESFEKFAATYLATLQLVRDMSDAQWQAGQTPQPREDTTERSKNMTSDPTPTITGDERRLALRVAVLEAEAALAQASRTLSAAHRHLTDATKKWQG